MPAAWQSSETRDIRHREGGRPHSGHDALRPLAPAGDGTEIGPVNPPAIPYGANTSIGWTNMHISRVQVRRFKRFHDLTIEIPGTPRLVVLCGPNGIGKSSLIDAFRLWHGGHSPNEGWRIDEAYHRKAGEEVLPVQNLIQLDFAEGSLPEGLDGRKLLYARSAYRHEADFQTSEIQRSGELLDAPHSRRMIDPEQKVSDNYQRMISTTVDDLYRGNLDALTVAQLRERRIGAIRDAMLRLFPDLELEGPGDPVGGGTFYFRKGGQARFHYKNLSGGEKAAFDLVLDLIVKAEAYDNTVFCIDEPELHMNTRVQAELLGLLLDLTPRGGQLWVATHSLGMMRRAQEISDREPSAVVFLDFEGHVFDGPVNLSPVLPNRDFWTRVLDVALGDLARLVAPDIVVLCEGRPVDIGNPAKAEFDARCYRRIFAGEFPRTDFVSVGNAAEVQSDRVELGRAIQTLISGTRVLRVVDRDLRSEQELVDLQESGTRVLRRRQLESYLLDPEILDALCAAAGNPDLAQEVRGDLEAAKQSSVQRENDLDDIKKAAGEFYGRARQRLGLTQAGNTTEAFLADTLAPLVVPGTRVYSELREDIFGTTALPE